MRTFSTNVQNVLNSNNIAYSFLVKLSLSQDYYFTSHYHDVVFDGNTYLGDSALYEFDAPKFSTVVDREAYRVVLTDLDDNMYAEFKANVVGKPIQVWVAFEDAAGQLMTNTADVISIYKGQIDAPSISNDFEKKIAVLEGTSPMADLDATFPFMTSKDGMDQVSNNDTSFDQIFENNEITLKWGKV